MTEIDVLLEEFNNELKEIKDKYEFIINKKISELNIPEEKYRNLIRKMGENFYQFSTELIDNVNKKELAEQRLSESEENIRFITENVNDVIIILNKDLKVEYVNELPLNRIGGYYSDDLIDKSGIDYIHPDDLAKALNKFTKSFQTGEASIEIRLKHKNGHYVWTEAKGNIILDHEENPKAHIIVRDISQRKITKERLRNSEERLKLINQELEEQIENRNNKLKESDEKYRQLFENSPNMIVLIDSNGIIIDVNDNFQTKLGDKKEDLIGKDFRNIEGFAIRNLVLFKEKFNEMLKQGNVEPFEIQTIDKDEKLKWINIQVSAIIFGCKDLFQVIIQDIEERKIAEQQLKESEEKYRLITENANDLMVIVNENLEFEWRNETTHEKLRGFSNKDRIGKSALNIIHPDDLDGAIKTFKKGFEVGEGTGIFRMVNKEGGYDWFEIRGKRFTAIDGKEKALLISRNISERKLAEQKLKESEEKFRTMADNSVIGITLIQDNKIKYVNRKNAEMIGYSIDEMLQWDYSNMLKNIYHEDIPVVLETIQGIVRNSESSSYKLEIRVLTKKGQITWIENFYAQIEYDGKPAQLITSVDITERKLAEKNLKESEERYRSLFENMNAGFAYHKVITDDNNKPIDYKYIEVNPSFEKLTGLKADDMIGKNVTEILPGTENDPADWIGRFGNVGLTGVSLTVEDYSDALDQWFKVSGYSPKQGYFAVTFTDITERKKAEQNLRESEEKYKALFEESPYSIVLLDFDGNFVDCNPARLKIFGSTKKELIGKNFRELTLFSPNYREIANEAFKTLLKEKFVEPIILQSYNKDGNLIWIQIQGKIIQVGDKKLVQIITQDIHERKIAEQNLIESEEKFRTMAENSLIGISITQDSQIKYVNKKNAEILGYSPDEMQNWDFNDIFKHIYPEDLPRVKKNMEIFTLKSEERSNQIDNRVITKAGKVIWVENVSARIHYEGKPARLITTVDITDRKIAEQKLKESEERFRTLFEVAPASIMVADLESNILMCNEKFCKLHGFENPEIVKGRKFSEFISKKDRLKLSEGVKETLEEKPRGINSYSMLKNDGTEFPAEATSSPIKDKDGNIIGIIGVAQDITERKKAEQIIKESEEKFRTIAEQSFMGVIILQDEKLKYVNEAAAKIFEYSSEEVMNWSKNYMVEKSIHPEDLLILREKRELRRRGEFNLKPYISYRVITKSGKIKWIDQFSRIIVYQGKEAELVSMIDITDQKEAEKIITEENKKLLELDQMRKELLTRVSHELKTPLVSIFSCSELLIDYYQEQMSEEVMKFVEIIHRGGKRLKDLIKNLLDASQIDAGKLKINKEKANLIELIRNCIDYVKFLVDDRKISLDYEFPEELFIDVDKIRIEQVFTNLLSNALKNTPSNGNIFLNITEEDNHIYTTIKDTGVGFTKKEMNKIFKKFGKIERYGKELDVDIEGSGLGLYISKEIVNLHDGQIWVGSEGRNKGATFTIKLPKNSK